MKTTDKPNHAVQSAVLALTVLSYLHRLKTTGRALPADAGSPNVVSMSKVAEEIGISQSAIRKYPCRMIILSQIDELGLEVR